ncbi:MAG: YfhO family protein, partial [Lachnospiraceae bacterium]|nr:YfhO family protein [Lachnospiraceae bacterium]
MQIVIGIQILLFVFVLVYLFRPKLTFRFPGSAISVPEWSSYAGNAHPAKQDSLEIAVSEPDEEDIVGELPIILPRRGGAYHIKVFYEQTGRTNPSFDDAQCYLDIYGADSHFLFDQQKLYDNASVSEGIVWALPFPQEIDAHFYLINKGAGDIVIRSVEVEESTLFCFGLIVLYLSFCVTFWVVIWLVQRSSSKEQMVLLALAAILFVCSYPLFSKGTYDTKDLLFHLKRIGNLSQAISHGDWHAWYEMNVANGYGYVEQIFYPQFLIHIPAILYLLDIPLYVSYKIYLLILNLLTVGVSYWSFRRIFQSRAYGVLSTALYSLATYRFLNLFGMNALGELAAKIFLPLLCYGLWKVFKEEKPSTKLQDYVPLMISGIGLVFSHVLTCEFLLLYVPLFLLMNWRRCISVGSIKCLIQSVFVVFMCGFGFIIP